MKLETFLGLLYENAHGRDFLIKINSHVKLYAYNLNYSGTQVGKPHLRRTKSIQGIEIPVIVYHFKYLV